ncbi:glyoxalase/bleomycin resistance/extradiol dioxygenase family protein [Rhizobium sp. P40RR-XXII]|uniref:VOC family protein n=1 Tax=unclassified Rhizobium TaxID=2613769 RepID=UPI0014575392|nr:MULTISPECIES: VOC family protein [unclassified Rhizobium]NLR83784.1 glyoxalase/bleomycin resistance/extradiol dioxygenase family protein [Rhizobium sp. P28RR-XV]NLS15571.1 glyoxalase/bleomycin resistance/extradiol dioxygenase family protein [Rhizobium sp. P40RR-XXII]
MRIAHTALWTRDLDAAANFWKTYFGATVGEPYQSLRRPGFISRFVHLAGSGDQIELMTGPWLAADRQDERIGWDHIAVSLGDRASVDALAERCRTDGCLKSAPRTTGDGFYEAVITMPDGTPVEITA